MFKGKGLGELINNNKNKLHRKKRELVTVSPSRIFGVYTNKQPTKQKKGIFCGASCGANLASWQVRGLSPAEYPKSPAKKVARKKAVFQRKVHSLSVTELTVTTSPSVTSS